MNRYTIQYQGSDDSKIELCVNAEHVTEAIESARNEVPMLKLYPSRIISVIRGCS